jgi:hypothetical protein
MSADKILAFLELEPRLKLKQNLTGQAKMNILQWSQEKYRILFCSDK